MSMIEYNDPVQIEDLLDSYVYCRTLGHNWDEHPQPEWNMELFVVSYGAACLRCVRCACIRYDYINSEMAVFARRYIYPPRYKTIPGMGTRPNLRAEMLRRGLLIRRPTPTRGRPRKAANGRNE